MDHISIELTPKSKLISNHHGFRGRVYDPNTGEELFWDKSKPRAGQWDMGHTPENKYSVWHKKYIKGEITKEEFLNWYRNPNNYRPESPSANRSHKYE